MKLFNKKYLSFLISHFSSQKGFTLIELLIVIAILGILAAGILVVIDPIGQLARGRDAGRKTTTSSLARAVEAYFISKGNYPLPASWMDDLVSSGEIKGKPAEVTQATGCVNNKVNGWCYSYVSPSGVEEVDVYTRLESKSESSKCKTTGTNPYFVWNSKRGSACLVCTSTEPQGNSCNAQQ